MSLSDVNTLPFKKFWLSTCIKQISVPNVNGFPYTYDNAFMFVILSAYALTLAFLSFSSKSLYIKIWLSMQIIYINREVKRDILYIVGSKIYNVKKLESIF